MSTVINEQQKLMSIIAANYPNLTELDKKIIQIAISNPPQFFSLIGEDALRSAKTCLLRQDKKSYGAIAMQLRTTRDKVRYACEKCEVKPVCDDE
jgi:hypothetical protein